MTDHSSKPTEPAVDPYDIAGDVAHPARVYDYVRGGNDNFAADRETADFAAAAGSGGLDHARAAVRANQTFLARAVTHLAAGAGLRQYLEVGTVVPADGTTHEIAQGIAPESRVVYANDDPVVLAHAHTLRKSTREGATAYVNADPRDPDTILRQAGATLDLDRPVGIVLGAILHHICDRDDPYRIVARLLDGTAPGSYLVISHLTSDILSDEVAEAARRINQQPGFTLNLRTNDEICRFFDGLELLPPGLVPVDRWHAPGTPAPEPEPWPMPFVGGTGRKP
jgi:hypothetical protein